MAVLSLRVSLLLLLHGEVVVHFGVDRIVHLLLVLLLMSLVDVQV